MSPVFISTLQTAEDHFPAHRSSSRPTPDVIKVTPFLTPFNTTVFSQGTGEWFEASSS
jgi:hypothetical protein